MGPTRARPGRPRQRPGNVRHMSVPTAVVTGRGHGQRPPEPSGLPFTYPVGTPRETQPARRRDAGSAEGGGVAFAPVAEGDGGCSGDVLDVVGDIHGTAGAEDLVQASEEVTLLGRGSLLNGGLGEFVRGDVLEVDRAAGHLGDGRDLLARGQGLRAGEEVPLACVAVVGRSGSPSPLAVAGGEIYPVPGLAQTRGRLQTDALISAVDQRDGRACRFGAHFRLRPVHHTSSPSPATR